MNRDRLSIVLGTILILLHGFSSGAWADLASNHGSGVPGPVPGRDSVSDKLPTVYNDLIKVLDDAKADGIKAKLVALTSPDVKEKRLFLEDTEPLLRWAKTFAHYRNELIKCENRSDRAARHLGELLDTFVSELSHLNGKTDEEKKISEYKLLDVRAEIKRVLEAKKTKAGENKSDKELLEKIDKSIAKLFDKVSDFKLDDELKKEKDALDAYNLAKTANPSATAPSQAVTDLHKVADSAIEALNLLDKEKVCNVPEEESTTSDTTTTRTQTPTPTPTASAATATPTATPTPTRAAGSTSTLKPGPITGGNPTSGPSPGPTGQPSPGPTTGGPQPPGPQPGPNPGPVSETGGPQAPPPGNVNATQPFDPSSILNGVQQALNPLQDVLNGLLNKRNADNDLLAAELANLKNNNDNDIGALLRSLLGQQQQPTVVQPQNPQPNITAPSLPPPQDNQPPFVPPQQQADQQAPPNPFAFMPPPQQAAPSPYAPPEAPRWANEMDYRGPVLSAIAPVVDPMAQMFKMMALSQYWQNLRGGPPAPGVPPMQQRIAQLGQTTPRPVLSRPGGLPVNPNGFATSAGVVAPNSRGPLPAALMRQGSMQRM